MDAVIQGIIGGATASLLIVVGGAIAISTGAWEKMTMGFSLFCWMTILTILTVGQLFLTYTISTALAAAPSQTEKGVVV
jgi:hypothetical protein